MTDLDTLTSLRERVIAAEGPDREIDAEIYNALIDDGGRRAFRVTSWLRGRAPSLDRYHDGWLAGKSEDDVYADDLVRYTASIDAALSLVERMLPGAEYEITTIYGVASVTLPVNFDGVQGYGRNECCNVTLAILAALLSALIANAKGET